MNGDTSHVVNGNGECSNGEVLNGKRGKLSRRDDELIRLIGQHLISIGLEQSANALVKESGTTFENNSASLFRQSILAGQWDKAFSALSELEKEIRRKSKVVQMKFLIFEQKFLELLDDGEVIPAFNCLRQELAPLNINEERLAKLAQVIMIKDHSQIRTTASWQGKGRVSRQTLLDNLQHYLPHHIMLPPRRLQTLLKQAQLYQQSQSLSTNMNQQSLLYDAKPPQKEIPEFCFQTIYDHKDEVTICKFSHNGKLLATGSKDQTVIIWNVDSNYGVKRSKVIDIGRQVCYLSWSKNDKMLLITGNDDSCSIWLYYLDSEVKKEIKQGSEDSITTCAWFPDDTKFVCAGKQGQFYMTDLSGQALEQWEGIRVYGIHHFHDMKFLASDSRNRIRCYDWGEMIDTPAVEENCPILSFSLSKDGNYALLNIKQQGLHLWDIKCNSLVRRYRGNKQDLYLIYSCFGGTSSEYLATGSEDHQIYIFHRDKETPISKLYGHTKSVSCVDWHPCTSGFLVSGSDDFTIKLWRPTTSGDSSDDSDSPDDVSSDSLD